MRQNAPLLLIVRDGYGINPRKKGNAIKQARTPNTDYLMKSYPHTILGAAGEHVGLPKGYQGNSEVGHLNLGAGRIVYQMLMRINSDISDRSFFSNPALSDAFDFAARHGSNVHLMGLVQDQGVHAHQEHLFALLEMAAMKKQDKVFVHVFSDGRDTPPKSAGIYIDALKKAIRKYRTGSIATITGRYYAMDRDNRWQRTELAYRAIAFGEGKHAPDIDNALDEAYKSGETDEFIKPFIIGDYRGVAKDDVIIFFNFRYDRPRQLTKAFAEPGFREFRTGHPEIKFVAMTNYYAPMNAGVAYRETKVENNLGYWLSKNRVSQLRISETEKYAHVTFFFNSQIEEPYPGEDRILIPSPKIATYDLKPEMSAYEVTERLLSEIGKGKYEFILLNLVNGDMVGHTGVMPACIRAVEAIDECIGKLYRAVLARKGALLITADHGNVESKIDLKTGGPLTAHTTNPVYLMMISDNPVLKNTKLRKGVLGNISPTVLDILGIRKPEEMDCESLIERK